jgi:hypothetical protein
MVVPSMMLGAGPGLTPFEHTITLRDGHIHRQGVTAARYPIYLGRLVNESGMSARVASAVDQNRGEMRIRVPTAARSALRPVELPFSFSVTGQN